ncbi:MAG: DUF2075 domain-containing protein, partial [Oxalobacteraceae bacterium]
MTIPILREMPVVAYAALTCESLLNSDDDQVISRLIESDGVSGWSQVAHNQISAWREQLRILRHVATELIDEKSELAGAALILEYRIPRREKRLDAALLLRNTVVVIEFKVGGKHAAALDRSQVLDYALDIAYYHEVSAGRRIVPLLCATEINAATVEVHGQDSLVAPLHICGAKDLGGVARQIAQDDTQEEALLTGQSWIQSAYRPIPGVIEAAVDLFSKHSVRDIKSALAEQADIGRTIECVASLISSARREKRKILCLLTGVPGAGKTLTGLQIAHHQELLAADWLTVFMTGNGPLIKVLRAALTTDYAQRQKISLLAAKAHATALLHSVHSYLAEGLGREAPPAERVVIFDEAQRAWDSEKMAKMASKARKTSETTGTGEPQGNAKGLSEPWQLLNMLDRHTDGAVLVALCGNGQEIHDGEAGVQEWVRAWRDGFPHWELACSPVAAELSGNALPKNANTLKDLHLAVPFRSH